ncbi:hypothetical protein ACFVFI_35900 [Streptomyces sp. NPDC057705]|uniref:Mu transposase domain-containing protein n=1 Tax=Streptomyces sp. NPDC057705 TaxID=3346222 RepID=UPI0036CC8F29
MDKPAVQMDSRTCKLDGASPTVAALAEAEPLLDLPTRPFPAGLEQTRVVSPQGLVSFAGNHYFVPPGLTGAHVTVRIRLGEDVLHVVTAGRAVIALERAVLTSFSDEAPCRTKVRRPPSAAAQAEAEKLRGRPENQASRTESSSTCLTTPPSPNGSGRPPPPTQTRSMRVSDTMPMSKARRYQQLRGHLSYLKLKRRPRSPAPRPAPMLFHMKASFQSGRPLAQPLRATIAFSWEMVRFW